MFMAFWLAKCTNWRRRLVSQLWLSQNRVLVILSFPFSTERLSWMRAGSPQQGHLSGTACSMTKRPRSRFSSTWGMIMFRLLTSIRQPGISSIPSIKERLCRLALDTPHPSISTGWKTATGEISPEREGFHSIESSFVSWSSSSNLKAIPSL